MQRVVMCATRPCTVVLVSKAICNRQSIPNSKEVTTPYRSEGNAEVQGELFPQAPELGACGHLDKVGGSDAGSTAR